MNGFEKRTKEIKRRIKRATLELLMTMETRTIRIVDIVKRADVSQVTIYKHFESKDNLIRESIQDWYINVLEKMEGYINDDTKNFQDKIAFIIFQEKQSLHQFNIAKLNTLIWQDEKMKAFQEKIHEERTLPLMLDLIAQGKEEGVINHNLSPSLIMLYLNILMEKAETFIGYAQTYEDGDSFIEDMIQLFFYGLAGKQD